MEKNLLKEKLNKGNVVFGVGIRERAIEITEILGLLGFDYVNIDCLHSPMSVETVSLLIRAAELRGITPVVRVPQNLPEIILRYLDVGAMGIIIGEMDNAEIAREAVKAVKYPPEGERGLSTVRAGDFGFRESLGEYSERANREIMVIGMVESRDAVENIDDILGTKGLDSVIVGTTDLSKSLGVPGQRNHPLVLEAVDKVLAAGKKLGRFIGHPVRVGEVPQQYIEKGFRLLSLNLHALVINAGKQFLENARG
jgi:4-hydroxy-2-oxoheptanedioate aldolase